MSSPPPVVVITAPTASGKSGLAAAVAARIGGTVINADSMQVYRELPVLTAQPGAAARALAPHRLYGVRPAAEPCTMEAWRRLAVREIGVARAHGRVPIVVGGTGLYLRALVRGVAPIPDVPEAVRARARHEQRALSPDALHARLALEDPEMAGRLNVRDTQRVTRALEVVRATGRSLAAYHAMPDQGAARVRALAVAAIPEKADLDAAIARRFDAMLADGALDEVRALAARGLDPQAPAMNALGVPPLLAHLRGEIDLETARARAVRDTKRYAKRQRTWLRRQTPNDFVKMVALPERFGEDHTSFVSMQVATFLHAG